MKKTFITIICSVLMFAIMTNSAFAQLSYTVQNIDDDIPGLTKLEGTSFYKFENDGKEYYMSKDGAFIMDYDQDAYNFFVKGLKDSTYVWTGEYYMLRKNELTYWQAYNELYKYSQAGSAKILFYDKNFNLVHEHTFPSVYISNIGYRNGQYYCTVLDGTSYISTDIENWQRGELDDTNNIEQWEDIYLKYSYFGTDLINYMSFDGQNYYEIDFEKNCDAKKATLGENKNNATPYIIRTQQNSSGNTSWLGISNDNIYYSYINLNTFKIDSDLKSNLKASKIFAADDYIYFQITTYSPDFDDFIVKIPLSEIDAELEAMKDAPIVVYDNTILGFEQAPVIDEGRTLIPIRFLFEKMGATVDWDGETQTATISQNNTAVAFSINDTEADVNGQTVSMDVPARLINDKTMVPVRFLSENLGYTVDWDGEKRIITIK